ncbi:hypothetical protein [Ensifer adhaerens]|uniref:hypothetical protein n=1 Tax=Ensifer adhaerens TaxID=106592 RepID=UPI000CF0E851|nr:hypothetical protein [Ensifer adhaerens]
MKLLYGAGVAGLLLLSSAAAVRADGDPFSGQWRQLTSTAGQCDICYIGIVRHGDLLTVSSNNGWQAVANIERFADLQLAAGKGAWKPTVSGAYGGRSFGIQFVRRGGQLQMFMVVSRGDGAPMSIRATFEKKHPASEEPATEMHRI